MKKDEHIQLTMGSKYRVRSLASREATLETTGTFRGVVSLGSIDALAMEVEDGDMKGKVRAIPTHMVLSIDILDAVKKPEEKADELSMHYS